MALRAVPDHPKFADLKRRLGLPKAVALGYLECIWHFAGRFTPQGNIGKYSDSAIEAWVEWNGEPGALIRELVEAHWLDLDPTYRILVHDWHLHADKATKQAITRAKVDFCVPTVGTPGAHSGVLSALPVPVPEPVPVPVPGPVPVPSRARVGSSFDESWLQFKAAAEKAGMRASDEEEKTVELTLWPRLDFEQKLFAIRGIQERLDAGEYADLSYVPLMDTYVRKRLWTRPIRAAPAGKPAPGDHLRKRLAELRAEKGATT